MNENEPKFSGWYIPKEIVYLFEDGTLSANELLLLALIDSLSRRNENGCFASNQHFADHLRIQKDTASRYVSRLIKMELLVPVAFDGRRRYLATSWSYDTYKKARSIRCRVGLKSDAESDENPIPSPVNRVIVSKNNTVARATRHVSELRGGFFGKPKISTFAETAAKKLENHVRLERNLTCTPSPKKWVRDIEALLKMIDNNKERLKGVLTWYIKNSKKEYVPEVHSANDFKEKFTKIEKRMAQSVIDSMTQKETKLNFSETDRSIYEQVKNLPWPKASGSALFRCVHNAVESYSTWRKKVVAIRLASTDAVFSGYLENLEWTLAVGVDSFLVQWFTKISARISKWPSWNGDLSYFTWSFGHKVFQKMGLANATEYAGVEQGSRLWQQLTENLNEN